jgi:acyl-CoA synthetase (AMP-forming)/AMP-acid ligase II
MSPNSIHYQLLIFACQCAGLVVSGANAAYTAGELAHQLTDASADLVLVHPDNLKVVLEATALAKWSKLKQKKGIIYAVKRIQVADNTWPAFDELMGGSKLEPVTIANPQKQVRSSCKPTDCRSLHHVRSPT